MISLPPGIGISAIAIHRPPTRLENSWFGARMPRKFQQHTGTRSRLVSSECEIDLALRAIRQLQRDIQCDMQDCAGIVFVSPSFVPLDVVRKLTAREHWRQESLAVATRELSNALGLVNCWSHGINWFCSGYAKALAVVDRRHAYGPDLQRDQFILVVTATRISRITDYECPQSGALFGDLSTVTLLSRTDSQKYSVKLRLRHAFAEKQAASGTFFNYEVRGQVLGSTGERSLNRLVFRLDGLGIADAAPRAMADALSKSLVAKHIQPQSVGVVVPHQAGTGIVRFASMKFEAEGVKSKVINDITGEVGNVSSSSIPFALKEKWDELDGLIACPAAGVGAPGRAEVTQGCILLERIG